MGKDEVIPNLPTSVFESFHETERDSIYSVRKIEAILGQEVPKILYETIFDIRMDCKNPAELSLASQKLSYLIEEQKQIQPPFSISEKTIQQPVRNWKIKDKSITPEGCSKASKVTIRAVESWLDEAENLPNLKLAQVGISEWSHFPGLFSVRMYDVPSKPQLYLVEKPMKYVFDDKFGLSPEDVAMIYFEKLVESYRRKSAYAFPVGVRIVENSPDQGRAFLLYATPKDATPLHTINFRAWPQEDRFQVIKTVFDELKKLYQAKIVHGDTKLDNILWNSQQDQEKVVFIDPKRMHFKDFEVTIPQDQRNWLYNGFGDASLFVSNAADYRLIRDRQEFSEVLKLITWVEFPPLIMNALKYTFSIKRDY